MSRLFIYFLTFLWISQVLQASIFDFFNAQHHQQQQQQQQQLDIQSEFKNSRCDKYLCQDSLKCVNTYLDCPCPFPDSEIKCVLPDKKNYVCFSKDSGRDCKFVEKAWKGLV